MSVFYSLIFFHIYCDSSHHRAQTWWAASIFWESASETAPSARKCMDRISRVRCVPMPASSSRERSSRTVRTLGRLRHSWPNLNRPKPHTEPHPLTPHIAHRILYIAWLGNPTNVYVIICKSHTPEADDADSMCHFKPTPQYSLLRNLRWRVNNFIVQCMLGVVCATSIRHKIHTDWGHSRFVTMLLSSCVIHIPSIPIPHPTVVYIN